MNVRLTPHSEELLREELARGRFHTPEEVIERALESLSEQERANRVVDLIEFDAILDALAEGSEALPSLPDEALTRQSIYQHHD